MGARLMSFVVPALLAIGGLLLTRWSAARVTRDAVCVKLAVGSYLLKILLTLALYAVAFHGGLSFAESGLTREAGGFWVFAEDAQAHHNTAHQLVQHWAGERPPPDQFFPDNRSFIIYMALLYRAFGVQPLNVSVLNAWYGTLLLLAGFIILQRLGATASARRWGVGLLGFWPSLLLWSSQPLKDSLLLTLTMLVLCGLVLLVTEPRRRRARVLVWMAWLGASLWLVAVFRAYTAALLGGVVLLMGGSLLLRRLWRRAPARLWALLAMAVLTLVVLLAAEWMTPKRASAPSGAGVMTRSASAAPLSRMLAKSSVFLSEAPPQDRKVGGLSYSYRRVVRRAMTVLDALRYGFVETGGYSLVDPAVKLDRPARVFAYLPRGIMLTLLAPFPRQWFETGGRIQHLRAFAAAEMLLIYLFLAGAVFCGPSYRRCLEIPALGVLLFILLMMLMMGLTVANVGTLFRLRLQFLLPLLLLGCLVGVPDAYRRGFERLRKVAG